MSTPTDSFLVSTDSMTFGPARITLPPTAWRLGRRNGELVLQAGSIWHQGRECGIEWNDVLTVDLDNEAQP